MFDSRQSSRRLALAGIVGPIVWWLLVIVNGALTPGYSHVSDFVSTLGAVGATYAPIQQINFAVLGGSFLAVTLGVHHWFGDGRRPRGGTVALGVSGVGFLLVGAFPANFMAPDSLTHVLHNLLSIMGSLAGIVGIGLVSRRMSTDDRWPSYRYEPIGTVVIVLVTFVVFTYSFITDSAFVGFTQRLFIGAVTLWVVLQSYRLLHLSGGPRQREAGDSRAEPTERKPAD